jgi:hypothetical protein
MVPSKSSFCSRRYQWLRVSRRSEYEGCQYNTNGQLICTQPDMVMHEETFSVAPTLYEYDFFGNVAKQTLALMEEPESANSSVQNDNPTVWRTRRKKFSK